MLNDFHAYQIAKHFCSRCRKLAVADFLQDQLNRASASIVLNIAEGSGRRTNTDQRKFYAIALGSLRECQAIFELEEIKDAKLAEATDRLGAILYKLSRANG